MHGEARRMRRDDGMTSCAGGLDSLSVSLGPPVQSALRRADLVKIVGTLAS